MQKVVLQNLTQLVLCGKVNRLDMVWVSVLLYWVYILISDSRIIYKQISIKNAKNDHIITEFGPINEPIYVAFMVVDEGD